MQKEEVKGGSVSSFIFLPSYLRRGGQGDPTFDTAQAIAVMLEKRGIACDMMHPFNWDKWTTGKRTEHLALIPVGQEHILEQEDGKKRWLQVVMELSRALMSAPALTLRAACRYQRSTIGDHQSAIPAAQNVD